MGNKTIKHRINNLKTIKGELYIWGISLGVLLIFGFVSLFKGDILSSIVNMGFALYCSTMLIIRGSALQQLKELYKTNTMLESLLGLNKP